MSSRIVKVAAVQAEPAWNDLQGGVAKTISIINDAAKEGANVIGFPEVWIPGYPWSIWAKSPHENTGFMNEYFQNSLVRKSPEMDQIRAAVKESRMFCVLGYSERYRGSLYIAQSFINENGDIVHHRRKIKPTHVERGYWGDADGESLQTVVPTPFGNIGGLNCWEHFQPLLRYYEYSQDVELHVSSWPLVFKKPEGSDWPAHLIGENCRLISHAMAIEGATFVMICSQVLTEKNKEKTGLKDFAFAQTPGGGFSMIYNPFGEKLVEPLGEGEEGILYATIDLDQKRLAQQNLDIVGHYSRPDQLSLRVNRHAAKPVFFADREV